jgi:hypothetical protein
MTHNGVVPAELAYTAVESADELTRLVRQHAGASELVHIEVETSVA